MFLPMNSRPCQGANGETPVCFRYTVEPLQSMTTHVFKPGREDTAAPRHATIGSAFVGDMDKIIANKRASVVWEANGQSVLLRTQFWPVSRDV